MDPTSESAPARPPRTTWRGISIAVLLGLVLGSLVSLVILRMRPVPTGIAHVELVELHRDRRAGPSWVIDLEAEREGYPFLIHIDDSGHPSVFFPDDRVTRLTAGERTRLPDPDGHRAWRSGGGELFVMLSGTPNLPLEQLLIRADQAALAADSGDDAREAAREVLRDYLGPGVLLRLPEAH